MTIFTSDLYASPGGQIDAAERTPKATVAAMTQTTVAQPMMLAGPELVMSPITRLLLTSPRMKIRTTGSRIPLMFWLPVMQNTIECAWMP